MITHDSLCPCFGGIGPEDWPDNRICQCELIKIVRDDERKQESARRAAKFGYWHDYRPDGP